MSVQSVAFIFTAVLKNGGFPALVETLLLFEPTGGATQTC